MFIDKNWRANANYSNLHLVNGDVKKSAPFLNKVNNNSNVADEPTI